MAKTGNRASISSADGIARALLRWYDRERRDLPWRRTRDPYAVWVSEVMLQQTRVATVLDYYARWMRRFPSLQALAQADEDDVLKVWQGLGYYRRARALLAGARAVVAEHGGRLPAEAARLRELPGIGAYTAGAIASIAFGVREPVIDGNVTRVLCRLYALQGDPQRAPFLRRIRQLAAELVPAKRPGDFNQALMELGATLCTPRAPDCSACPVASRCIAHARGLAASLPRPKRRPAPAQVHMVAAVVRQRGRVLLVQLPAHAPRWAGMWQFPTATLATGDTAEDGVRRALEQCVGTAAGSRTEGLVLVVRHSVTRFSITLDAYGCGAPKGPLRAAPGSALTWKLPSELGELALPAAHRKIASRLQT
jgi:A/G-specific adenine glycosylase